MTRKVAILLALAGCGLMAQHRATFEVVSIRPYISDGNAASEKSSTNVLPGGRFTAQNVTVRKIIRNALGVEDTRISGAPGWIDSESYNIEAKTAGGVEITRDNLPGLLESLLTSRFGFRFHRESTEASVYSLEVAKNGPRMKASVGDGKPGISVNAHSGMVILNATGISLHDFAGTIARQTGRPVVDRTGLSGDFDIDLTWSADQSDAATGPSIFTAVQELGLRLVSTKAPVEGIVIDRVEKVSEN